MGLLGRKDPQVEQNRARLKEFKRLVKKSEYEAALRAGARYLEDVPHNHDVLFAIGGIHYMQKQYRAALSYLDRALEIGSYDTEALLLKAYSHQKLGDPARATSCCKKIREVDPNNKDAAKLLADL